MLEPEMQIKLLIQERPWEHEPDREEWVHELTGYKCTVWRHPTLGHLCGYVAVPKGHRCHGWDDDGTGLDVDVHGGLTYAAEDKETGEWVFGFDCNHADDFNPKLALTMMKVMENYDMDLHLRATKYRTFEYVKGQVKSLARQLKLLDMKGNSI